jgi:hypothetical protein
MMAAHSDNGSSFDHCHEPRHRELFAAVVATTRIRSSTRQRSARLSTDLREFFERNKQDLDLLPGD